jgi:hypothetical protein
MEPLHRHAANRVRVIAVPVPRIRLLHSVEARLREMYEGLLHEPVPARMIDVVRRHEAAFNQGGPYDGTVDQSPSRRVDR